ncbi:MarR family winged helix-turn-helix transcriptional regulator [Leptolyngbya sp. NIES-2104]|uniref:MarR family winged helix-turn-helix transcriptional regulator n=1 Tax=Leptolyngbya sp. NIES-2104 TaxID=1552121 RepID=UPI0006ECCEA5|nr:MarR family transcriptional regulator [Leptolyngbya sp. NIES-2104]GAP99997.1 transcriptional regulator, MarR family [Leptolyngbya sp. NIES-2104]
MQVFPERDSFESLEREFADFDAASIETCLGFLNATAEVYAAFDAHFDRYGLSAGKFTILMQLYSANQDIPPSEFAERANVTRATITGLLDGLEREGLVKRKPHPNDRRMLTVHLTQKGRNLIQRMLPDHFCRTKKLMSNLSETEKKTFVKLLKKLCDGTSAFSEPHTSEADETESK